MSNSHLVDIIRKTIQAEGPIPFVRFMDLALYHPEQGYYSSLRPKIGPQGDYYTSPGVHPVFAKLLAKQLLQMVENAPLDKMAFIEFGPGDGRLCQEILQSLAAISPSLFDRLQYILIETSPGFKKRQQERLLPRYAPMVQWADRIPASCVGVVFSNEFLDALPVHRVRIENGSVHEIYVDWKDGFVEILHPPSSEKLVEAIKNAGIENSLETPPMTLEINLHALDWIRSVGQALTWGFVMTIDYGYPAQELYHSKRSRGTLLCYHQHTVNENPYDFIGEQDITSHIDFTALARAGTSEGLTLLGFTDQTHFLMGLGIAEEMQKEAEKMEQAQAARKSFLSMKQLMAPDRMGKTFKVLIQGKGVVAGLDGLIFPAFPKDYLLLSERLDPL